ncbi:Rha family transcriptional regulator, partial [Campylobacter hyointestinalis]|uniref:Rha family transcriptional regulator n=1 Tax=Campylobacter hyointestinalis TaxID=198 RepID=UPI000A9E0AFE
MNAIVINNINVNFEVVNERVFINSLELSKVFEKDHKNILRLIENLPNDEFRLLNFKETERTAKFGAVTRSERFYNLTRDGFSLLVMGFTGQKAYRWKIEFIKAFNKMEAMIK